MALSLWSVVLLLSLPSLVVTSMVTKNCSTAPIFKQKNMPVMVAKSTGSVANLRCPAEGNPVPNITWLKDNMPIKRPMGVKYRKWGVFMEDLGTADNGLYVCIVFNELGSINHTFSLEVKDRFPIIKTCRFINGTPRNITVYVGETARFECFGLSDLQPPKWWKYYSVNGSSVNFSGKPYIKQVQSDSGYGYDPHYLVLTNVTLEDAGQYACSANNSEGVSRASAWLTVLQVDNSSNINTEVKFLGIESNIFVVDSMYIVIGFMILATVIFLVASIFLVSWHYYKQKSTCHHIKRSVHYEDEFINLLQV